MEALGFRSALIPFKQLSGRIFDAFTYKFCNVHLPEELYLVLDAYGARILGDTVGLIVLRQL